MAQSFGLGPQLLILADEGLGGVNLAELKAQDVKLALALPGGSL